MSSCSCLQKPPPGTKREDLPAFLSGGGSQEERKQPGGGVEGHSDAVFCWLSFVSFSQMLSVQVSNPLLSQPLKLRRNT